MKWFVSCITPKKHIGIIQLEASLDLLKPRVEALAPCRCEFKAYEVEEFDDDIPVGKFITAAEAKALGY